MPYDWGVFLHHVEEFAECVVLAGLGGRRRRGIGVGWRGGGGGGGVGHAVLVCVLEETRWRRRVEV